MNIEQLKKGNELKKLLEILDNALKALPQLKTDGLKNEKPNAYWLTVSKHSDGSGAKLDLNGIDVPAMIVVIEKEIKRQHEKVRKEFEKL